MKLLYTWINENDTGFIRQQGFNFDANQFFSLLPSDDGSKYILACEIRPTAPDIWKSDEIVGLTALVGENGTGKTSLLRALYSPDIFPWDNGDRVGYAEFCEQQNRKNKKLLIYRTDGEIRAFHNFQEGELENQTSFTALNINNLSQDDRISFMETIERQTIIYLSNSNYAADFSGYSSHVKLSNISMTPGSVKTLSSSFYKKITSKPTVTYSPSRFITLQDILRELKTTQDFQQICDVIYHHYLLSNHSEGRTIPTKKCTQLNVSIPSIIGMLQKHNGYALIGHKEFTSASNDLMELSKTITSYSKWVGTNVHIDARYDTLCELCLNLILEMLYSWNYESLPDKCITCFADCTELIEIVLSEYDRLPEKNAEQFDYYKNGLDEINLLHAIIKDCQTIKNVLPRSDGAYRVGRVVSSEENIQTYNSFCECIDRFAQAKHSVVLKYIQIDNSEMSSGERALQNMFSWLHLPPHFDKYIEASPVPIRDDVLLLIDEIDLYMHPEWQRQCLKIFSDELKLQYPDKRIQIVVSTHSPLVLSDVPIQNTIYLKRSQDGIQVEDNTGKPQTFGANIHELLNDAFFLNNTMGAFAYERIKLIADNLIQLQSDLTNQPLSDRCRPYLPILKMIGEPLIQHKLLSIYYSCFPNMRPSVVTESCKQLLKLPQELSAYPPDRESAVALQKALKQASEALNGLLQED